MKKQLSLILAAIMILSLIACGTNSEDPIIKEIMETKGTSEQLDTNTTNDEIYSNKAYFVGDEIPEGQYIVKCTKSSYGMDVVVFASETDYDNFQSAEKYTNGEYKRAKELHAWTSFYINQDEYIYISVKSGNVIFLNNGMCEFNKYNVKESNTIYSGVYIVGEDIEAGNININCPTDDLKITIFENRQKYTDYHKSDRYTVGEERIAIENNSLSSSYIYMGNSTSFRLENGMIIMINDGVGEYSIDEGPKIN